MFGLGTGGAFGRVLPHGAAVGIVDLRCGPHALFCGNGLSQWGEVGGRVFRPTDLGGWLDHRVGTTGEGNGEVVGREGVGVAHQAVRNWPWRVDLAPCCLLG